MNKITIKNPSEELIEHALRDIQAEYQKELVRTAGRACNFLSSLGKGEKTFRSKPITITIKK